jgi:hypothetical protein
MGTLLQFETNSSATVQETFTSGTTLTDLDGGVGAVPVVTITRPDGTTIASGTVTRVSTGLFQFVLAGQPNPTELAVTWTGTIGGQPQTRAGTIEILGAQLFTVAEFRAWRVPGGTPFKDPVTYPDSDIHRARAEVLEEFTQILGYSPVPRFHREIHSVRGWDQVLLNEKEATRVLSVTVSGVAQVAANFYIGPGGTLTPVTAYQAGSWPAYGYGNVVVEYVAGLPRVPGRGRHAAMLMAGAALNPAGFSTAQTVSMPTGETYTYEPTETGRGGFQRHTGVRELDRWLNRWAPPRLGVA